MRIARTSHEFHRRDLWRERHKRGLGAGSLKREQGTGQQLDTAAMREA